MGWAKKSGAREKRRPMFGGVGDRAGMFWSGMVLWVKRRKHVILGKVLADKCVMLDLLNMQSGEGEGDVLIKDGNDSFGGKRNAMSYLPAHGTNFGEQLRTGP
jgi:hypothetical protein